MITGRSLLLFGFVALLSGCVSPPCVPPNELSKEPVKSCYYQLEITHVDEPNKRVSGKVPNVLVIYDREGNEEFPTPKNEYTGKEFTFTISHFETVKDQLIEGKVVEFVRHANSPVMEAVLNQK